jgi:hypothetical protein
MHLGFLEVPETKRLEKNQSYRHSSAQSPIQLYWLPSGQVIDAMAMQIALSLAEKRAYAACWALPPSCGILISFVVPALIWRMSIDMTGINSETKELAKLVPKPDIREVPASLTETVAIKADDNLDDRPRFLLWGEVVEAELDDAETARYEADNLDEAKCGHTTAASVKTINGRIQQIWSDGIWLEMWWETTGGVPGRDESGENSNEKKRWTAREYCGIVYTK